MLILLVLTLALAACVDSNKSPLQELQELDPSVTLSTIGEELSVEDAKTALKRMRPLDWGDNSKVINVVGNNLLSAISTDDTFTYFYLKSSESPAIYMFDGVGNPVSSVCSGKAKTCAVKGKADRWILRSGDSHVLTGQGVPKVPEKEETFINDSDPENVVQLKYINYNTMSQDIYLKGIMEMQGQIRDRQDEQINLLKQQNAYLLALVQKTIGNNILDEKINIVPVPNMPKKKDK